MSFIERDALESKVTQGLGRSRGVVLADLKLDHLFIVYPGEQRFPLGERVTAIGLADVGRGPAWPEEPGVGRVYAFSFVPTTTVYSEKRENR